MTIRTVPLELHEANALVALWHRHHVPARGCRWCIGAVKDGQIVGAAIVSRPVAIGCDARAVAEVVRLVTDGTRNACSALYAACARTATAHGFQKIQTYTLPSEGGASLRAAGWSCVATVRGRAWIHTTGPRRQDQPQSDKWRWEKILGEAPPAFAMPETDDPQMALL